MTLRLIARALMLTLGLALVLAAPGHAGGGHQGRAHGGHHRYHHAHGRVFVGVGPWWWGAPYPYWYDQPPFYSTSNIVVEEPLVYIQGPAPTAAAQAAPTPNGYWYYCPSTQAYYPDVSTCEEPWVDVRPRSE